MKTEDTPPFTWKAWKGMNWWDRTQVVIGFVFGLLFLAWMFTANMWDFWMRGRLP